MQQALKTPIPRRKSGGESYLITTKDLAKICGVSRTTIDRALNGKNQIREETREYILRTARENGYRPDLLARTLVKGKSMSIGGVVFNVRNQYFSEMLGAIQKEAARRGYFVYFSFSDNDPENEIRLVGDLIDRRVDGILLCPVSREKEFSRHFGKTEIPIVTVGNRLSSRWHHVGVDDFQAVQDGLTYVLGKGLGYERFLFLCPPYERRFRENIFAQQRRVEGFTSFFRKPENRFEHLVITSQDYLRELHGALYKQNKKTLIFCSSDIYAFEVLKAFREDGTEFPNRQLGLMSFDKTDAMDFLRPKLTVIDTSAAEQGSAAADTLLRLIAGESVPDVRHVGYSIVEGNTV
jgi:LacI family transcriptional regulator